MGSVGTNVEALEVRIKELELENMSLKSQLDKYQTIFALQGETVGKQVTLTMMTILIIRRFLKSTFHISRRMIEYLCRMQQERQRRAGRLLEGWAYLPNHNPSKTYR